MQKVGNRVVKSSECLKKKSKIAHNFFMTIKVQILKLYF